MLGNPKLPSQDEKILVIALKILNKIMRSSGLYAADLCFRNSLQSKHFGCPRHKEAMKTFVSLTTTKDLQLFPL